jgi:OMF family outer membrane factor
MRPVILGLLCILISSAAGGNLLLAGDIPLAQAIEKGILMDAQMKNRRLDSEKATLELEKAEKNRWFNLDLKGSYLFKSEQMEVPLPGMSMKAGAKHNYDMMLGLTQPIYTGNVIDAGIKIQQQKVKVDKQNVVQRQLQVTGQIKSVYFTVQLLESKKTSLQLLIKNLQLHLDRVNDLFKEDLAKKSDLLETRLKIVEAGMQLEKLQREITDQGIAFKRLTGYHIDEIEAGYLETAGEFTQSMELFRTLHPALKAIGHQKNIMELQKKAVSGKYLPQVGGFAELHYGRPGVDFFKNDWSLYFQGGISVSLKLFDWNKKKRDHMAADKSITQLQNQKTDLLEEVEKKLKQLYNGLKSIESQLTLAKQLAATAAQDAELKEELYKENQSPNIDYLSALIAKEQYDEMQQELIYQGQLLKVTINMLVGGK